MGNAPAVGRYKKIRMTDGAETATRVSAVSMHDVASQIKPAFRIMVFLLPTGGRIDDFWHDMPPSTSFWNLHTQLPSRAGKSLQVGRPRRRKRHTRRCPANSAHNRRLAHKKTAQNRVPAACAFDQRAAKPGTVFFQCKDSIAVFSFRCQENKIVLTICFTFIFNVCTI